MGYTIENYKDKESKRAFILDAENIRSFYRHGMQWIKDSGQDSIISRCEVFRANSNDSLVFGGVEPLFDIPNTKKQEIIAILLHITAGEDYEFKMRIQRDPEYPTLLLKLRGPDQAPLTKKFNEVSAEIKELNQWYSFFSNRILLREVSQKYNWIFWVLALIFLLIGVWGFYTRQNNTRLIKDNLDKLTAMKTVVSEQGEIDQPTDQNRFELDQEIAQYEKYLQNAHLENYFTITIIALAGGAVIFVLGYAVNKGLIYLFPRGIILIGAEVKRHNNTVTLRRYIYGIVSAIFATLIASIILKKTIEK